MARVPTLFTPGSLMGGFGGTDPFFTLQREMNRLFNDVMTGGPVPATVQGNQGGMLLAPQMDVTETEKDLRIKAELPGVNENDIEVALNDDLLTIRAEKSRSARKSVRACTSANGRSARSSARCGCRPRSTRTRCRLSSRMAF